MSASCSFYSASLPAIPIPSCSLSLAASSSPDPNQPPMPFFLSPASVECIFIQFFFFFLVSDGSSDSSPPVSPPRARKGEYSSRLRYKAYNVIIDPIRWYMCARCITKIYFLQVYSSIFASISFYIMNRFLSKIPRE